MSLWDALQPALTHTLNQTGGIFAPLFYLQQHLLICSYPLERDSSKDEILLQIKEEEAGSTDVVYACFAEVGIFSFFLQGKIGLYQKLLSSWHSHHLKRMQAYTCALTHFASTLYIYICNFIFIPFSAAEQETSCG